MANYGMLRNYRFTDTAEDIRGSKLYGLDDEKLGKIDDVIFDHTSGGIRYVVVDTGGWLSTKKFLVPADRLRVSSEHEDDYAVDLTKAQVENFPLTARAIWNRTNNGRITKGAIARNGRPVR